ncbi:Cys-tRNA(Pro) deacylase, partial [Streptomyces sp. SID10244]|nr:Cys-tRNA(Pro) deacylase [Streptomyces sp. SID10244]
MAATPAVRALERAGIDHAVHRYPHDPRSDSYGDEAVAALGDGLGVHADQIFKTLVIDIAGTLAVAVVPVPRRLSLKAAAA